MRNAEQESVITFLLLQIQLVVFELDPAELPADVPIYNPTRWERLAGDDYLAIARKIMEASDQTATFTLEEGRIRNCVPADRNP
jgi:hypothetical protein